MIDATTVKFALLVGAAVYVVVYILVKWKERRDQEKIEEAKRRVMASDYKRWTIEDDPHATEL